MGCGLVDFLLYEGALVRGFDGVHMVLLGVVCLLLLAVHVYEVFSSKNSQDDTKPMEACAGANCGKAVPVSSSLPVDCSATPSTLSLQEIMDNIASALPEAKQSAIASTNVSEASFSETEAEAEDAQECIEPESWRPLEMHSMPAHCCEEASNLLGAVQDLPRQHVG